MNNKLLTRLLVYVAIFAFQFHSASAFLTHV